MATNGASARQWLADNGSHASPEDLQRIRTAIAGKLDALPEEHPDETGLLEALDVMDEWITNGRQPPPETMTLATNNVEAPTLDTSSLTPDLPPAETLSPTEKQARFRQLLNTGVISTEE